MHVLHVLHHVGQAEGHHVVAETQLQDDVGLDQSEASVEGGGEGLLVLLLDEVLEQRLGELLVLGLGHGIDGILEHLVLLGDLNGLVELLVHSEQVGGNAAELQQLVVLELVGKSHLIEVVVTVDGLAEILVVLLLNVELVEGVVDVGEVSALDALQVVHSEGDAVGSLQLADDASVVQVVLDEGEETRQEHGMLSQDEVDGTVVQLVVVHLDNHLEEVVLLVGGSAVLDDGAESHIEVLSLLVQIEGLVPHAGVLASANGLGGLHTAPVDLEVLHDLLLSVLGVEDGGLGEDSGVGILQSETLLHDLHELLVETSLLVGGHQGLEVIGGGNNVQSASLGQLVLLGSQTSLVDLLPGADVVGLLGGVHGLAVLLQADVGGGELGHVVHVLEENAGSLVHLLVEAAVSNDLDLGHVGSADQLLELAQAIQLGEGVGQGGVHTGLLHGLADHLQVADQGLVLLVAFSGGDHVHEGSGILGGDVSLDGLVHLVAVELGLGDLSPHGVVLAALSVGLSLLNALHVLDQNGDSLHLHVELLVDQEGAVGVSLLNALESQLGVEVVQTLNVLGHAVSGSIQTGEDEQVLQRLVLTEVGSLKDQTLEQIQEGLGHLSLHEGLHGAADHLRVLTLGQSSVDDLVNNLLLVLVVGVEHALPEGVIHTLNEVASLILEQTVLVGHADEILIASTTGTAVGQEGQEGIDLLAELTNDLAVVVRILQQELLGVLVVGDVDLTNGVVELRILASLAQAGLQPGLDHAQTVALLADIHQRGNGAHGHDRVEQLLDEVLGGVHINQLTHNDGGLGRSHLLDEGLNVLSETLLVQVLSHILDHIEAVAQVDQSQRIGQVGVDQQGLHLLGIVGITLTAHALDLLELAHLDGSLDELQLHSTLSGLEGNSAQEVEETLGGGELLEHIDDLIHTQVISELLTDLHHQTHVGRVVGHQSAEHLNTVLSGELANESHQELGLDHVSVHHHTLDVVQVGVHGQSSLEESRALAQLSNLGLVEVAEHVGAQDSLGHLSVAAGEVDLQHTGLEISVLGQIASLLEHLQQETGALLDQSHGVEGIRDTLDVQLGASLGQALGEALSGLGVLGDHTADDRVVVGVVVVGLSVLKHLLVLLSADQRVHNLFVALALEVDGHGQLGIHGHDHVSESLAAGDLILLHPLLQKRLLVLGEDESGEGHSLNLVQTTKLHNRADVHEEGRLLARSRGHLLQLLQGVLVTNQSAGGLVGDLSSTLDIALLHHSSELLHEDVISTGETQTASQIQSQRLVLQAVHHERHEVSLLQGDLDQSTLVSRQTDDTSSAHLSGQENGILAHARAEQQRAGHDIEHVHETHLGHHVRDAARLINLHAHGEIASSLRREGNVSRLALEATLLAQLHSHVLAHRLGSLLLDKGEQHTLSHLVVHVQETSAVSSENLRLLVLNRVQLDGSSNAVLSTLANTDNDAPLLVGAHTVLQDLASSQVSMTVEHLSGVGLTLNAPVENGGLGDNGDVLGIDPAPVGDGSVIGKLERAQLSLVLKIEHLESSSLAEGDNLLLGIHDGGLSGHRHAGHLVTILKIHNGQTSSLLAVLTDANMLIGLGGHELHIDVSGVNTEGSQLAMKQFHTTLTLATSVISIGI